jgi:RNA polymerase sigma-32 factor
MQKLDITSVAKTLNVDESEVRNMEATLFQNDTFFTENIKDDENASQFSKTDYQADETFSPEYIVEQHEFLSKCSKVLHEDLAQFDQRSREIIERRWLGDEDEKVSLKQLADKYGVSGERIRQIESDTLQKLRLSLTKKFN